MAGTVPSETTPTTSESRFTGGTYAQRTRIIGGLVGLDDLDAVVVAAVPAHAMGKLDFVALRARRLRGSLENVRRTTGVRLRPALLSLRNSHLPSGPSLGHAIVAIGERTLEFRHGEKVSAARATMIPRAMCVVYPRTRPVCLKPT